MNRKILSIVLISISVLIAGCGDHAKITQGKVFVQSSNATKNSIITPDITMNKGANKEINKSDFDVNYKGITINDSVPFEYITKQLGTSEDIYQLISQSTEDPSIKRWYLGYPDKGNPDLKIIFLDTLLIDIDLVNIPTKRGLKVGDKKNKILELYGSNYSSNNNNLLIYNFDNMKLKITINENMDKVADITLVYNSPKTDEEQNISHKQTISYLQYENGRFGFSIDYPNSFITKLLPDNNDGIVLSTPEETADLTISGINNVLNETPASAYRDLLKKHSNVSYKKQIDNWFVVSWIEGDKIVYQKSVVGSGSINTFVMKYLISQKDYYSSIISHINSSFKTPEIDIVH